MQGKKIKSKRGFTQLVDFGDALTKVRALFRASPKLTTGFSLLELLIYVAILSVLVVIISNTFISLSKGSGQSQAKSEVNSAIRFAAELLKQDIKNASVVTVPSTSQGFGTSGVVTGAAASQVANAIAIDATYMYVAGNDVNGDWRIEKRLLSTGAVDSGFGTSGVVTGAAVSQYVNAIAMDSTYMYIAGYGYDVNFDWRIEKRLLSTGAVDSGFGTSGVITGAAASLAQAIAIDATYMYVAGYDVNDDWRIEKRLLSTGAVDSGFGTSGVITGANASLAAYAIALDATYMYVAGYDVNDDWRIEKRLLSTGAVNSGFVVTGATASYIANAIAIDSTYMYVAGYDVNFDWRIEKRLLSTGAVDSGFGTSGVITGAVASNTARAIAIDATYMYVAGYDVNGDWRIEKRLLSTGAVDSGFGTSGVITGAVASNVAKAIAIDATYMYVAGDGANIDWRIEKRLLGNGSLPSSTSGSSSTLTLTRGGVEIVFDVSGGVLRRKEGTADSVNVTNANITVNAPTFTRIENTNPVFGATSVTVKISMTFSYNSTSPDWNYTDSLQTSVGSY